MTKRTLDLPVLVTSLAMMALLAVGGYFAHAWQLSRLSSALLTYAQREQALANWLSAANFLDRFLHIHPQDARARGQLAEVYGKGAKTLAQKRRAVQLHYRALAAEPTKSDADRLRASLAELLVDTGRFLEAENEASKVIAENVDHPIAHRALALSLFTQWKDGSLRTVDLQNVHVLSVVERARYLNPSDVLLAELTATIYQEHADLVWIESSTASVTDRQSMADAGLNELVEQNSSNPQAYLARYRYRRKYNQMTSADADLQKALALAPQDPQVLLTAATARYSDAEKSRAQSDEPVKVQEYFASAKGYYEQLILGKQFASIPDPQLGLGDAFVGLGDLDQAIKVWKQGLKRFAQPTVQSRFHARIADALLAAGRESEMGESLDAIDAIIVTLGASVRRNERLALLQAQDLRRASWHLKQGRAAAAIPSLQDVVARRASGTPDDPTAAVAWNLLGRAYTALGEWGEAAVAFDRAMPLQPANAAPRLSAAIAWLQMGRGEIAADRAEQAITMQPTAEAWFILATAEYQVQLSRPSNRRSWKRFEQALHTLELAPAGSITNGPWRVDFLQAELANIRGLETSQPELGRAKALEVLQKAATKYDSAPEFWRQACLAFQRFEATEDADRAMVCFQRLVSSPTELALAKASLATLRKDYEQAALLLKEGLQHASAFDQSRLRLELVEVALAKRDLDLAHQLLTVEARARPGDPSILRRLTELALERGDLKNVVGWEADLAATGPLGQSWSHYFRAMRHFRAASGPQDPQLVSALEDQARLAAIRPHWPMSFTLRGMVEQRMGKLEQAVASYERAVQLGERRYVVFEQLIGLLDRLNRSADAEEFLARLEGYMPHSQRLTEIVAGQRLRHDQPEQALEIARKAVDARPGDPLAHLWLGRLLMVTSQTIEAERELNRAVELAPQDVRVWNGMFSFHLRNKNTIKAREILRELEQRVTLSPADRNFVVAQGHELLGEWDRAAKEYEAAAQDLPDRAMVHVRLAGVYLRSDPQRAKTSLRRALEIDPKLTVARRMLAALLAARGTEPEFHEAEQLLSNDAVSGDAIAIEDRRLNAILLAQYGHPAQVERAVQILEELVTETQGSLPGDRLILARLYENQARSTSNPSESAAKKAMARKHLVIAASVAEPEPTHIISLVDFLMRNKELQEGARWLDKVEALLRSRRRDNPQSIAQFIELLINHGNKDLCSEWLDRLAKTDPDPIRPVALRARWMHAAGHAPQIAPMLETAAQQWMVDALDAAERARVARAVGDIYLATDQLERAKPWYTKTADNDPAQFSMLVLALAREGDFDSAIHICTAQAKAEGSARPAIVLASVLVEAQASSTHIAAAEPVFAAAVAKFPKDTGLLYRLATLRATEGNYHESIRLYREVVKLDPKHVAALNNLALILAESPHDRAEALAVIDKAIAVIGQQPGLLDTKGAILVYQGRSDQAISLLEAATREEGTDVRHRFHLAAAYRDLGDSTKARDQLQAALDQQLERQLLTQMDRKLLVELKTALIP